MISNLLKPIALPTETVYGIFAPIDRPDLIDQIYVIKKRESRKKLLMMFADISEVLNYFQLNDYQLELVKKYSPGKVTFLGELRDDIQLNSNLFDIVGNSRIAGFRITSVPIVIEFIKNFAVPFAQSSLNISGESPILSSKDISSKMSLELDYIYNSTLPYSIPSTIVRLNDQSFEVIRQGDCIVE